MSPKRTAVNPDRLEIVSAEERRYREGMFDLVAKTFCNRGYYDFLSWCRAGRIDRSHYDWKASRIGVLDGQVVTHFGVYGYTMRIGTARVRVGGIGMVATHGDLRGRGLMARTAQAAIDAMRDQGYDMSILFGIAEFYRRFGYVRAWSDTEYFMSAAHLPTERPATAPRKFALRHRDDIVEVYNREHSTITGTAVRPTYAGGRRRLERQGYLWTDPRGRTSGYLIVARDGGVIRHVDSAGDAEQRLRVLGTLARRWGCQEVRFGCLPYESPLCRRLRRGNCRAETRYHRNGGPLIRTLNLASTLRKLSRELSRRLRASHLADWRGKFLIADPRDKAVLSIDRSKVRVGPPPSGAPAQPAKTAHAVRGGEEVAQLIIGTDSPSEVVAAAGIKLSGEARRLTEVLFPNQHPMLSPWDRF